MLIGYKRFTHDCNVCIYLGTLKNKKEYKCKYNLNTAYGRAMNRFFPPKENELWEYYDLYYHEMEPTVVARYGNEGHEYMSGIWSGENSMNEEIRKSHLNSRIGFVNNPLTTAIVLAIQKGYLKIQILKQ